MKEKRLRRKVWFTLCVLMVTSALCVIPVPGVNQGYLSILFSQSAALSFLDTLSGGAMSKLCVGGFGITSYISASIILQLMAVLLPKLEEIWRDGYQGRKLMEKTTFLLAMAVTLVGSTALSLSCGKGGIFTGYTAGHVIAAVICWMAGSAATILLAQQVEYHGIGNGITMVLAFNILSRVGSNARDAWASAVSGKGTRGTILAALSVAAFLALFYILAMYLQAGVLKVPIEQSQKKASALNTGAELPVPVNIASVLPVVYASSLTSLPAILAMVFGIDTSGRFGKLADCLSSRYWYSPEKWYHVAGFIFYVALVILFGIFSAQMSFSPEEAADGMKKNGDVIPGVNPGQETARYLAKRRNVMAALNIGFLLVISTVPDFICARLGITEFTFLGTSAVIVISMLFDTSLRARAASLHNDKKFLLFPSRLEDK